MSFRKKVAVFKQPKDISDIWNREAWSLTNKWKKMLMTW
jgi:hypothetical protein